jgi:hypothetical protein
MKFDCSLNTPELNEWLNKFDIKIGSRLVLKTVGDMCCGMCYFYNTAYGNNISILDDQKNIFTVDFNCVVPLIDFEDDDFIYQLIYDNEVLIFKTELDLMDHMYKYPKRFVDSDKEIMIYKIDPNFLTAKKLSFNVKYVFDLTED